MYNRPTDRGLCETTDARQHFKPVNLHSSLVCSLGVEILRFQEYDEYVFKHGLDLCMGYWSSGMIPPSGIEISSYPARNSA